MMMNHLTKEEITTWIDHHLADPRLEPEALLRKRWAWIWMVVTFAGVLATCIVNIFILKLQPFWWCGTAILLGFLAGFFIYPRTKRFDLVINILFSFLILMGFFIMVQSGGLKTSLGSTYIGINCIMVSALAGNLRWTIGMFLFYCLTIGLLGILDPMLETPEYITPETNAIAFFYTALWSNAAVILLLVLYMRDKFRYEKAESERLRQLDDAKTMLYSNVSHEFRTPLTVIQGVAEQMEQHPEKWRSRGPEKIKTQSRILLDLVNQMLDISKLEAGVMRLKPIRGDICQYIQHVADFFQSQTENKGIELQVQIYDQPIYTDYDPEKMMHVLTNLISNAIKFTPSGGIINIRVTKENEGRGVMVEIHIWDNGKSIPKEAMGHIFERFYRIPAINEQTPGTGLGLYLTSQLVHLMKGNIRVESKEGRGTEFIVKLPVTRNAPFKEDHGISLIHCCSLHSIHTEHKAGNEHEIPHTASADKPILLIVEDNSDLTEYLVATLEGHYMIELATNGKLGLEKATEIIPDIILTDLLMPQMCGLEMLRLLRKDIRTDHIPVVVLTARGDFNSQITGLKTGADHYLVKPFSQEELLLKLNNLMESRRRMQQKLGAFPATNHKNHAHYRQQQQFLSEINALLEDQLHDEDFGIKEICLSLHMSRPQLYRKFSALTDMPIGKYIRIYRLHKAKTMIEEEGKNVTEAALESGFRNLSHFSSSFRDEFGYPPSELL
ncbi:MAG: ATP-binding protein [Bacteroidales bacterium]